MSQSSRGSSLPRYGRTCSANARPATRWPAGGVRHATNALSTCFTRYAVVIVSTSRTTWSRAASIGPWVASSASKAATASLNVG